MPQPAPIIYNGENYTYLDSGTFNDVYINEKRTYVLKVYKDIGQQRTVSERNARVWNACKRSEIGDAAVVTYEIDGSNVSAMKVPFLPYPTAQKVYDQSETQREKVMTAIRKESIRIFLSTGRIIADGHLDNFLYDEKTNTAHCIDHDLAHDVTLTELTTNRDTFSSNLNKQAIFENNLHSFYNIDATGIGRTLDLFVKRNIIKLPHVDEELINKISNEVLMNPNFLIGKNTVLHLARALETALYHSGVNPLFYVQSDIRAYVNLRLRSVTTLQGVQGAKPKSWQGKYNKKGKLNLLKNLLTSIQQCNPKDKDSLESLLMDIQEAKKNNLKMEGYLFGSGITFGMYQTVRAIVHKKPGGELGKLLNNCEEHVNDIKAGLSERPALKD